MTGERNIHATAIVAGDHGFLLLGPSGSGKSACALTLIAATEREGRYAALVADDQVFLSLQNGQFIAHSAASIYGKLEIRGAGIVEIPAISRAILHFAVKLVPPNAGERLPAESATHNIEGLGELPLIHLPFPSNEPWFALRCLVAQRSGSAVTGE